MKKFNKMDTFVVIEVGSSGFNVLFLLHVQSNACVPSAGQPTIPSPS